MEEIQNKVEELEGRVNKLQRSVDRLNKIILWTFIISAILVILPLIGLMVVIPQFLSMYTNLPL
jgi:hypothetical protein